MIFGLEMSGSDPSLRPTILTDFQWVFCASSTASSALKYASFHIYTHSIVIVSVQGYVSDQLIKIFKWTNNKANHFAGLINITVFDLTMWHSL